LRRERFDPRYIAPNHPNPRGVLKLACRPLKAQIELLFLEVQDFLFKLIFGKDPKIGQTLLRFHGGVPFIQRYVE
jgi:hypothetical protein